MASQLWKTVMDVSYIHSGEEYCFTSSSTVVALNDFEIKELIETVCINRTRDSWPMNGNSLSIGVTCRKTAVLWFTTLRGGWDMIGRSVWPLEWTKRRHIYNFPF